MAAKELEANGSVPSSISLSKLAAKVNQKMSEQKQKDKKDKKGGKKDKKDKKDEPPKDFKKNQKKETPKKEESSMDEDTLLKEVEMLGGSKADLDLIDIDSGDESEIEFGEDGKGGAGLQNELSAYMKDIGLVVQEEKPKTKAPTPAQKKELVKTKVNPAKIKEIAHSGEIMVQARSDWYNPEIEAPPAPVGHVSEDVISKLHEKAKELLEKENSIYVHDDAKSTSQKQFLNQLLTAGTLNDKISALTLLIQESPLHSLRYFETMIGLCKKKSKGSAMQGVAALKDLFVGGVLPDRKLRWFKSQPVCPDTPRQWLILWAFEDWLKSYFFSLLQILETLSHDPVVYIRTNCVAHVFDLLKQKPEQEVNLLRLGVNKLGDQERKVASRVSHLILQLEQAHPAMKTIITEAVSELIFRTGVDYHARYYSVITLNQTIIAHKEVELANSLMRVYLSLFERMLSEWNHQKNEAAEEEKKRKKKPRWNKKGNKGKKGGERQVAKTTAVVKEEEDSKLTSAILTGLNRAYPFSDLPRDTFDKHLNTLYRVTHSANFNTSVQALILIHQVSKSRSDLSDRYYRTLYESLLDPRIATSSKLRLYLNLLFKSLKEDSNLERSKAFAKRLVQMASSWINIGVVAAVVHLVRELEKAIPNLRELLGDEPEGEEYDGRKRDPLFANAGNAKFWEMIPMLNHFHPTVAHFAEGYINGDEPEGTPDITLHTLSHFLDRFVYKNPRQKTASKGSSIMQPLSGADTAGGLVTTSGGKQVPATASAWGGLNLEEVDVSERFFHQYFTSREETKPKKSKKRGEGDDEFDEEEVWKALVDSNPQMEGGDGEGFSDFDDEDLEDMDISDEDISMEDGDEDEEEEEEDVESEAVNDDESEPEFEGFDEDDDGMLESDDEIDIPMGSDESDDEDAEAKTGDKRSRQQNEKKSKRARLRDLPEFVDADDYAKLLASDNDD